LLHLLLTPNLFVLLLQLVLPTSSFSIGELLWFELFILALALASAVARGLVGDRTARWVGRACWALLSASVIALCLSGVEVAVRNSPWVAWGALLTLRFLKPRGAPREPVEQPATEELYQRLLDAYLRVWGGPPERARERLEADIEKLVQQGLSREGAVKELYESTTAGAVRRALE
jgi:hypothetical protein